MKILVAFRVNECSKNRDSYNTLDFLFVDPETKELSRLLEFAPDPDEGYFDHYINRFYSDDDEQVGSWVPVDFSESYGFYIVHEFDHFLSLGRPCLSEFVARFIGCWSVFGGELE